MKIEAESTAFKSTDEGMNHKEEKELYSSERRGKDWKGAEMEERVEKAQGGRYKL